MVTGVLFSLIHRLLPSSKQCPASFRVLKAVWLMDSLLLGHDTTSLDRRYLTFRSDIIFKDLTDPRTSTPLNSELNPVCHLLALVGAHHILHVSRVRVKVISSLEKSGTAYQAVQRHVPEERTSIPVRNRDFSLFLCWSSILSNQ